MGYTQAATSSLPAEPATQDPPRLYGFGPFTLDTLRGRLWKDGVPVYVRPKDIEILSLLVESRDRVVEKNEIFGRVWPSVVVEENNIARRISELRRVLGEQAGQRSFVVTYPGRGYRFVADVVELTEPPRNDATPPPPIPQPAAARPWRRVLPAAAVLVVILAVAGMVAVDRYPPASAGAPVTTRQLTFGADVQQEPVWSPDGRRLAYVGISQGRASVFIQDLEHEQASRLITADAAATAPAWSPDGRWIAYRSDRDGGAIWMSRDTGEDSRLVIAGGLHPQWSPDGGWILYSSGDGQDFNAWPHVVRPDGTDSRAVFMEVLNGSQQKYSAWHPDGRLSTWFRDANGRWRFVTGDIGTGHLIESEIPAQTRAAFATAGVALDAIEFPFSRLEQFLWAPSGTALYFEALVEGVHAVWRVDVDPRTLAWKGGPFPITTGAGNHSQIAMSRDGNALAFAAQVEKARIWSFRLDRDGLPVGDGQPVTQGRDVEVYVRSSLDGGTLMYRATQGRRLETRLLDAAGDRALVNGVDRSNPVLSPDGKTVAFVRFGPAGHQYYTRARVALMNTHVRQEQTVEYSRDLSFAPNDWSRDGAVIVGKCGPTWQTASSLCSMHLGIGPDTAKANAVAEIASPRLSGTRLRRPSFSPDSRWVAFAEVNRLASEKSRIMVTRAAGGEWIPVASGDSINDGPRWSDNGRLVYFISNRTGSFNVWAQRFDPVLERVVGAPVQITRFTGAQSLPYTVDTSIDVVGTHLLVPVAETSSHVWALFGLPAVKLGPR